MPVTDAIAPSTKTPLLDDDHGEMAMAAHRNAPEPDSACLYGLIGDVAGAGSGGTETNAVAIAANFMAYLPYGVGRSVYLAHRQHTAPRAPVLGYLDLPRQPKITIAGSHRMVDLVVQHPQTSRNKRTACDTSWMCCHCISYKVRYDLVAYGIKML